MINDKNKKNKKSSLHTFFIDLHYKNMKEIKQRLVPYIRDLFLSGYRKVTIIHGYRSGQCIKDFLMNNLTLRYYRSYDDCDIQIRPDENNLGRTHIYFNDC